MTRQILANVRPLGLEAVDLVLEDGLIADIVPTGTTIPDADLLLDAHGLLALPGFVNAHAHVDKSWWGMPWVSYGGEATTQGRIAHERAERDGYGIPSLDATVAVLREFLRHGTTAVRSHVDVDLGVGLGQRSCARLWQNSATPSRWRSSPSPGRVLRRPGVRKLLDKAAAAGATSIGGLDPASIDRDPVGQLDALFEVATRRGVGLDIHLHDGGELGAFQFELIIERTLATGMQGQVNVSHGFALGDVSPARQAELVARLGEADISWTSVAPVGTSPLPWRAMLEAGVNIGLGTDGIRDLWAPFGDGDMLKIALGFARLHRLRTDEDLTRAVELATSLAAPFVHRERHGLEVGSRADIVLVDAQNVPDALVRTPPREFVLAGGRPVVENGRLTI